MVARTTFFSIKSLDILGLRGKISILGIAKRLEEIYFPGDKIPLYLDKKSETLKILQRARDEAHRFGIAFHKKSAVKKYTIQIGSNTRYRRSFTPKAFKKSKNFLSTKSASEKEIIYFRNKKEKIFETLKILGVKYFQLTQLNSNY